MEYSIRQGCPCTYSDVVSYGMEEGAGEGITLNFYHHIGLSSGQCVCAQDGDMFFVIVHCIRSGWPFDKASFCDIRSVLKKAGDEEKTRRARCQNVVKHGKARQTPLCYVCIKTRSQQSSPPRALNNCMTWKSRNTQRKASVNCDTCGMQGCLVAGLHFIIALLN